jgi:hypothetical protein
MDAAAACVTVMNMRQVLARSWLPQAVLVWGVLALSCAAPAVATSSQPPLPTVAAPTASVVATAAPSPARPSATAAPGLCSNPQMTTRAVIGRYFDLSTSGDVQAVSDCFAKAWRERNATGVNVNAFADGAALWSHAGPATAVIITLMDVVNGCDRFSVNAQMANAPSTAFRVPSFFTVGRERGTSRIFETGTALVNAQSATTACK